MTSKLNGWELASVAFHNRGVFRVAYLWGAPGIGKTYTAMREGVTSGGVYSVTLTPETPAAELRGFFAPRGGEFVWQDGPVISALRAGGRLVINEVSHASSDVLALLYPLLESSATAAVPLPNGEQVKPAEGFQVILTDNFPPDQLPEALRDRMDCTVHIDSLHPDALAMIDERYREPAIALAQPSVDADRRVSVRGWLRLQAAERVVSRERAFALVFGPERGSMLADAIAIRSAK